MNKQAKLTIIAKIERLPHEQQGATTRLFETVVKADWAYKMPYLTGLLLGVAGVMIFPSFYDLEKIAAIDSYLLGILVGALCFWLGVWLTKFFYFTGIRRQAIVKFRHLLSASDENQIALRNLRGMDPNLRYIIDQIIRNGQ